MRKCTLNYTGRTCSQNVSDLPRLKESYEELRLWQKSAYILEKQLFSTFPQRNLCVLVFT